MTRLIEGAPGHGEGHNSGVPLNIIAALAVKKVMEREHLKGTIRLWPGVAEEDVGTKAYYVRAGMFKDVDICLFAHVATISAWGGPGDQSERPGVVEYMFKGESAHAAAAPWRGRSALDAVELMDVGWNFRREHLRLAHARRITSSPMAAISPTWCRPTPPSGITSARPITSTS
jgi:aminobenzoyl-glutamate utilization protein B